jgi:lysophospholipase L1-like esterase
MPLGDSITRGGSNRSGGDYIGYRGPLWAQLIADGVNIDFVGSCADGPWAIDANHEGHGGFRIDQLTEGIRDYLGARPDIVLLHIGTNDLLQGVVPLTAAQRLAQLLDRIHQVRPSTHVIVASLFPVRDQNVFGVSSQLFWDFNSHIESLVKERAALDWRISYVDMATRVALQQTEYDSDGIHPANDGYVRMAAVWRAALEPMLRE